MISLYLALLVFHWVADFILQTHWQASNKSKNLDALSQHVLVYSLTILVGTYVIFGPSKWVGLFILVNGTLHFATDYVTSRITSRLYAEGRIHDFFVIVGLDQLLHQITLAVTMVWLLT